MCESFQPSSQFITFEGGEGAGKSTHIAFLARCLRELGYEVLCLREPGGTAIGEALRSIVLDPQNACMDNRCELFIYEAARAQIVAQVIKPALERGAVVLCDRFCDSTMAYQAFGRALSADFIAQASRFACQGVAPARTILMVSATAEEGLSRATREGADRIEQAGVDFHARVNAAFAKIAEEEPDRVRVVPFAESKAQTAKCVFDQVKDLFPGLEGAAAANPGYFERIAEKPSDEPAAPAPQSARALPDGALRSAGMLPDGALPGEACASARLSEEGAF